MQLQKQLNAACVRPRDQTNNLHRRHADAIDVKDQVAAGGATAGHARRCTNTGYVLAALVRLMLTDVAPSSTKHECK